VFAMPIVAGELYVIIRSCGGKPLAAVEMACWKVFSFDEEYCQVGRGGEEFLGIGGQAASELEIAAS